MDGSVHGVAEAIWLPVTNDCKFILTSRVKTYDLVIYGGKCRRNAGQKIGRRHRLDPAPINSDATSPTTTIAVGAVHFSAIPAIIPNGPAKNFARLRVIVTP